MESERVAEAAPSVAEGTDRVDNNSPPEDGANNERSRGRRGGPNIWRRSWQTTNESRSDGNRRRHRRGGTSRFFRRVARRLGLSGSRRWTSPVAYNTFRYGMVLLYLGTLFMVIGYHNSWVSFMKFLGLAMVILGILCVGSALGKSFSLMFEARNHGASGRSQSQSTTRNRQNGNGYRTQSSQSKASLPNYEEAVNMDLPNYDEAESLRLNPKYLTENWLRRHSSVPFDPGASGSIGASTRASLPNQGHISVIMIPERPPPQYSDLAELDAQFELSDASLEVLRHQEDHHHATVEHVARPESSLPRRSRGQVQSSQYAATMMSRTPSVYGRPRTSHNFPTSRRRSETRLASANRPFTSRGTFPDDIPEVHLTASERISQQRSLQRSFSNLSLSSVEDRQNSRSPNTTRPQTTMTIMVRSYSSSSFESDDDASQSSISEESSCWDELQRAESGQEVEAPDQGNGQSAPEHVQDIQMEDLDEDHVHVN